VPLFSKNFTFTSARAARPHTAVELTPEGVLAAAVPSGGATPVYAFASLPAGALSPGISGTNVVAAQAVTDALRGALDQVSPRSPSVTLVIPDIAVRVFVLDFDSFPAKPLEALAVLRFRLRKMVPFDSEHAAVTYQLMVQNGYAAGGSVRVLVTVMPGPILAEYEAAVRAAQYEPGVVMPSSLAALAALSPPDAALAANLSSTALTTSITSGDDILLYRTMDLSEDNATRVADVQRNVAVAAAYFEDKLGHRPRQLHYAGAVLARDFSRAVDDAELEVIEIAPVPSTGATTAAGPIGFAGVTGALAGVA
jgi:type IV pilus assembly protein PilM